jgi:hypothetical protein
MSIDEPIPTNPPLLDETLSKQTELANPTHIGVTTPRFSESNLSPESDGFVISSGPGTNVEISADINGEENISHTRASSVGSDAYEPPEPNPNTDNFETAFSPPFSPAQHDHVESVDATMLSLPLTQADEALTVHAQEQNAATDPEGNISQVCPALT